MGIRTAMEEAFQRGEKIKEQILQDVMGSQAMSELLQNEYFLRSLTMLINTKYELKKMLRHNLKSVLKVLDLPSRDELHVMERKLNRLENEIGGIQRKAMTARLAKSAKAKKTAHHSRTAK